jgi:hypothetical protein
MKILVAWMEIASVRTYVGEDDQDAEDSDPNGHVQVGSPVLNNQTASSQVCGCRHNIL